MFLCPVFVLLWIGGMHVWGHFQGWVCWRRPIDQQPQVCKYSLHWWRQTSQDIGQVMRVSHLLFQWKPAGCLFQIRWFSLIVPYCLFKYLLFFQLSLKLLMLNFGVLINSLFLPKWPSITAIELCSEKPIAIEKKVKNMPI